MGITTHYGKCDMHPRSSLLPSVNSEDSSPFPISNICRGNRIEELWCHEKCRCILDEHSSLLYLIYRTLIARELMGKKKRKIKFLPKNISVLSQNECTREILGIPSESYYSTTPNLNASIYIYIYIKTIKKKRKRKL